MPIQLDANSRIEFALNLTTDVLLALLKHPELAENSAVAHRAVNIAITTLLAFEQSGVMDSDQTINGAPHARTAN